jgi:hypothetical protein
MGLHTEDPMTNPLEQDKYETHDIYLAAYFKISGCKMSNRYRQGRRWFFVFENPGGTMRDMREAYYSGNGQVTAKQFADEIIAMKQLCFE